MARRRSIDTEFHGTLHVGDRLYVSTPAQPRVHLARIVNVDPHLGLIAVPSDIPNYVYWINPDQEDQCPLSQPTALESDQS